MFAIDHLGLDYLELRERLVDELRVAGLNLYDYVLLPGEGSGGDAFGEDVLGLGGVFRVLGEEGDSPGGSKDRILVSWVSDVFFEGLWCGDPNECLLHLRMEFLVELCAAHRGYLRRIHR